MWQVRRVRTARAIITCKRLGISKFKWLHGGSDACPEHVAPDGRVFALSNPPVIDKKTGLRGYPGDLPDCRCRIADRAGILTAAKVWLKQASNAKKQFI
jgi:uncharacterized protein with gpF-like domain